LAPTPGAAPSRSDRADELAARARCSRAFEVDRCCEDAIGNEPEVERTGVPEAANEEPGGDQSSTTSNRRD
jgi:hypothetical protein